jgi:rubrerythrin
VSSRLPARPPSGQASAFEIFGLSERIEHGMARLYHAALERLPLDDPDRALFFRLEREEEQHAARIRLLVAQYRTEARLFGLATADLAGLEEGEREAEALREAIAAGRWDHDPAGLKRQLGELEARSGTSHAEILARSADPRIARFFGDLARQDAAHQALLAAFAGS